MRTFVTYNQTVNNQGMNDKEEIIERLLDKGLITDDEANILMDDEIGNEWTVQNANYTYQPNQNYFNNTAKL